MIIQNTHNKIYSSQKDSKSQMLTLQNIVDKIDVNKVQLYFTFGNSQNAYQTAMVCGYAYAFSSSIVSYLIAKNSCVDIFQDIDPTYNVDSLDITAKCILQISLLDLFLAIIASKKQLKENGNGKTK